MNDSCSNEHNRTKRLLLPDDADHQLTYLPFFKFLLRTTQMTDKAAKKAAKKAVFECNFK